MDLESFAFGHKRRLKQILETDAHDDNHVVHGKITELLWPYEDI